VPTRLTTPIEIMARSTFALGVADVRAGRRCFHPNYDQWSTNEQWAYERGRAWAVIAPRNVQLKMSGKINPDALRWFTGEII
jgi:hypothetical protein